MRLRDLLKILDNAEIEGTETGCYKEMYCKIIYEKGDFVMKTINFKKSNDLSASLLDCILVSLDEMYKWEFMFSDGLKIYVTIKK